jgi:hypothetical protein
MRRRSRTTPPSALSTPSLTSRKVDSQLCGYTLLVNFIFESAALDSGTGTFVLVLCEL